MPETESENSALTDKQQVFVNEYLVDMNAKQAAVRAGYSERTAQEQGSRLLSNVKVKAAIDKAMTKREERTAITQDYVLNNLQKVAERCMQAVPVMEKVDGEWVETGEFRFDSAGANRSLELLGKHLKMFTDKTEVSGPNGGALVTRVELVPLGPND